MARCGPHSYTGAWSGPTPLNRGGRRQPRRRGVGRRCRASSGATQSGNLWTELGASYGWFGAQKVGLGGLASDPTVVVAGQSTFDAVWRTQAGSVWAAAITSSGGPAQVEVDKAVSMGRPVASGSGASSVTVVMQRPSGGLASAIYAPANGWIGPELLNRVVSASSVSVVNWYTNAVAAFWQESDGSLWWSAACAGCAAHLPPIFS